MSKAHFKKLQTPVNMIDTILLVLAVFLSCIWILDILRRPRNLPPGPWELPIVGSLLWLGRKPHQTVAKWRRRYGDVIYCNFGAMPVVILNSYEAVKEAFVKQAHIFAGRPDMHIAYLKDRKPEIGEWVAGVVLNEGTSWQQQRRFTLSSLRDFGLGKSSLEGKVKEEVEVVLQAIEDADNKPFDIGAILEISIANVICSIIFGNRYDYEDKGFRHLLHTIQSTIQDFAKNCILSFLPFLQYVPPFAGNVQKAVDDTKLLLGEFKKYVDEHKESFDADHIRDFIDAYLFELQNVKQDSNAEDSLLNESQLLHILADLFGGGSDTTNTTLKWGILYMADNLDVQKRVQQELDEVVGRSRLPNMQDKVHLTYTEACCNEMLRMSSIVPFGLMRKTTQATEMFGYHIPEGITVIANLWGVHMDDTYWKEPKKFDPQRFIDDDGKLVKHDNLIPFSLGKRSCLGEALARMELYLFFTCLLQRFTFTFVEGEQKPDLDGVFGLVVAPHKYDIIAMPRI